LVSDLILKGQEILRPNRKEDGTPDKGKLWPMPEEKVMRDTFSSIERDAFAGHPDARNAYFQTAQAIYAAKSAEIGDASGVIDSGRWDDSIKLATGGIEKYNGRAVVLPWGVDAGKFKDGVRTRIQDVFDAGRMAPGVTPSQVSGMSLEMAGDGRYVFRAGDGILVDKSNRPVIVDFNQPPAWRPSGYGMTPTKATPGFGVPNEVKNVNPGTAKTGSGEHINPAIGVRG
jgi:hypothetical protein